MPFIYNRIGTQYGKYRKPDARIASAIIREIGDARTIVNVGAGVGSYEPRNRYVVAVEPSTVMISQRSNNGAPVVRACAESLPSRDNAFDTALLILTIHH